MLQKLVLALILVAVLGLASFPAMAADGDIRQDKKALQSDRKDIRQDRHKKRADKRDLRHDRRNAHAKK